jgi:uncharacterized protein (TIGR03067 family)
MYKALLLGCVAVLSLGPVTCASAQEIGTEKWEYKAVSFHSITNADEATKLLNELAAAGWIYVGPLANDFVAFKRPLVTPADVAVNKQRDRLQGTWTTISTELDGQQRAEESKKEKLVLNNNKWVLKIDGEVSQEGTYKIVEMGDKYMKVDFVVTDGFKQGDTWISILQVVDGDKIKWNGCYISESKTRAKAMSTREGDGYFLRTMRRDKEK